MIELPDFVLPALQSVACAKCRCPLGPSNAYAIGLNYRAFGPKEDPLLFIELQCPRCRRTNCETAGRSNWIDFAIRIADWCWRKHLVASIAAGRHGRRRKRPGERGADTPITEAEVVEIKKLLDGVHSHEDFMRLIGLSASDIKRYTTRYEGQ